jgi:uncharacterized protein YxjI
MGLFDYKQYMIDHNLLSGAYMIKDSAGNDLGRIEQNMISTKYTFYDAAGVEVGRIEAKALALQPSFNILDPGGITIATLKGLQTTFHGSEYWFENAKGEEILRARGKFPSGEYQILDPAWSVIAEINMGLPSEKCDFSVAILSPNANRYLVLAAVACIDGSEHHK